MKCACSVASRYTLEVEVTRLEFLAREKDLALGLSGRARLYRDGELLDERRAQTETDYRRYEEWAADQAQPLRRAVALALARLSEDLSPR
jgi:hypothetical protein